MNETGWTHKIDSIGSTGTDILVKAIEALNTNLKEFEKKIK